MLAASEILRPSRRTRGTLVAILDHRFFLQNLISGRWPKSPPLKETQSSRLALEKDFKAKSRAATAPSHPVVGIHNRERGTSSGSERRFEHPVMDTSTFLSSNQLPVIHLFPPQTAKKSGRYIAVLRWESRYWGGWYCVQLRQRLKRIFWPRCGVLK